MVISGVPASPASAVAESVDEGEGPSCEEQCDQAESACALQCEGIEDDQELTACLTSCEESHSACMDSCGV